jgi:SLT domain-containing protein
MARVASLGINILSHWNGRGMRQARRNLNQLGDGLTDAQKDAQKFNRSINRMSHSSKMLARSLKRPHRDLRRLGRGFNETNHDANRFRRTMRALGRVVTSPLRGIRNVGRVLGGLAERMIDTDRRGRGLGRVFKGVLLRSALLLAPALLPIINHLAGIAAGLLAMSAAAAIGFGGFLGLALLASKRTLEMARDGQKLSKVQRKHVQNVKDMKGAWDNFLRGSGGAALLKPLNIVLRAVTRNMGKLKPLVLALAPIFNRIARAFASWMDRSNGFRRFVRVMKKDGVPIMRNLAAAARSVLKFLGRAFRDSLPGARKLSVAIRRGAKALANWAAKGGFKRWLNKTKKDGPKVRRFFKELKKLMPKLLEAIRQMAPVSLKLATALLKIANSLSPGQIRALMWAFILAKPALVAFKIASWGVSGALWLVRRRAKKAGDAVGGAAGKAKKGKSRFGKLGDTVKRAGRRFGNLAATIGTFLIPSIGRLLIRLGGGTGLTALLRGGGLAAAGAAFAMFNLNLKHGKLSLSIDDTIDSIKNEWHQLQKLGETARNVAEDIGGGFMDAVDWAGDVIDDDADSADKANKAFRGLGKGTKKAADSTKKYANSLKPANKRTKKMSMSAKEAKKKFSGFSNGLDRSRKAAQNFGKGAKKGGNALGKLSRQSGISRKELKKMGVSSKDARKMLKDFGGGAVKSANQVKNKAGGAFRHGARNLKKNWGGATLFVRRTTRKRLLATIHQTRAFRNKLGRLFNAIKKDIKKKWGKTFDGLAKTAKKKFNAAEKQAKQFRKTVARQFKRTQKDIKKTWGKATDQVRDFARKRFNKAADQAKKFRKNIGRHFNRIKKDIKKTWGSATDQVRDFARKRFKKAASTASNFRKDIIRVFERIRKAVKKSWGDVLDNVKNRAKKRMGEVRKSIEAALKKIKKAFDNTTDAIKKIWQGRLPAIFKRPIKFFVEVVYNKGLRKAWNATFANLPGIKELKKANVGFAQGGEVPPANQLASGGLATFGGRVRGPGGPTADKIPAALSSGEYVIRASAVKNIGIDTLNRINQGVGGDLPKRGVPISSAVKNKSVAESHFAEGGMLGSRSRHNRCSYYSPQKFAEGGFIQMPSIDINEVRKGAISRGIKAAKKSKMLGNTAMFNFSGGNMSNGDSSEGGFDWGTNLYQDVAKKVGRTVITPFINAGFNGRRGSLRPAGEWAEVAPTHLKEALPALLQYIWEHANTGCGTGGFAPFRPWRSGDGARVGFRGVSLDRRTRAMCLASEAKLGKRMSYFQGSWSGAAASAGTHAGGGAVDTGPASYKTSGAMRASGFAAWARGPKFGSGSFSPHVHGIAVGNRNLSGPAAAQVKAFQAGRDGLAGNRPDNQPGGAVGSCSVSGGGCGVKRWAGMAQLALRLGGCPAGPANLSKFLRLMKQESCGNPNAINRTDSNAAAGIPSQGLMQVIPPTFRANHVAGTSNNILDPLANMAASARYIRRQYGCNIPQAPYASGGLVTDRQRGGHPRSFFCGGGEVVKQAMPWIFDTGGTLRPGLNVVDNRTGGPERLHRERNGHGHDGCTHVHIHGNVFAKSEREFRDMVVAATADAKRKGRK